MQPRDSCLPWRGILGPGPQDDCGKQDTASIGHQAQLLSVYKDLPVERGKAESEQPVTSTDEGRAGESHRMRMILEYEFIHLAFTDSLEKTLMLGKTQGRRRRGRQRMRWLDGITDSMASYL